MALDDSASNPPANPNPRPNPPRPASKRAWERADHYAFSNEPFELKDSRAKFARLYGQPLTKVEARVLANGWYTAKINQIAYEGLCLLVGLGVCFKRRKSYKTPEIFRIMRGSQPSSPLPNFANRPRTFIDIQWAIGRYFLYGGAGLAFAETFDNIIPPLHGWTQMHPLLKDQKEGFDLFFKTHRKAIRQIMKDDINGLNEYDRIVFDGPIHEKVDIAGAMRPIKPADSESSQWGDKSEKANEEVNEDQYTRATRSYTEKLQQTDELQPAQPQDSSADPSSQSSTDTFFDDSDDQSPISKSKEVKSTWERLRQSSMEEQSKSSPGRPAPNSWENRGRTPARGPSEPSKSPQKPSAQEEFDQLLERERRAGGRVGEGEDTWK